MSLTKLQQEVLGAMKIPLLTRPSETSSSASSGSRQPLTHCQFLVCGEDPQSLEQSGLVKGVLTVMGVKDVHFCALDTASEKAAKAVWMLTGQGLGFEDNCLVTPSLATLRNSPELKRLLWRLLIESGYHSFSDEQS
jgi:hypothetical protein